MPVPVLLMVRELDIGGIERDVAKIAVALDRERFEPHVACFFASGMRHTELCSANIPIVELPVRSFRSASLWHGGRAFVDYVRRHGIRLVHSWDPPTTMFAVPASRFCHTDAVVSSQLGHRDLCPRFDRLVLRATDKIVDRIVVNCEAMKRHLIQDEGVRPEQVYLCYNGVDFNVFFPANQPKPQAMADAALVIGAVCALRPEKRIDLLLTAFARVDPIRWGLKLAIVGSGSMRDQLQAHASALGILQQCVFQPTTTDVAGWLRAMDIFVLPSDSEAFSNALLEAMACGCCPIGSRVGGTPELIEHETTGLLFERGNVENLAAMLRFAITDGPRRKAMATAAARFVRNRFSIDRAASTIGDLYASLLK